MRASFSKMTRLFLVGMLVLSISCAKLEKRERGLSDPLKGGSVSALDKEMEKKKALPKVLSKAQSSSLYGPYPVDSKGSISKDSATKNKVVALKLGPGMARTLLYSNVLKALEKHEIPIHVVSGSGLGAVFATMLAFGLTPDLIEWRVFNFINETRDVRFFSSDWLDKVEQVLLKDFIDQKIEQATKVLLLPVFDIKRKEIIYLSRGSLREAIKAQFEFKAGFFQKYSSPIMEDFNDAQKLKNHGADFTIGISALSRLLSFERADGYLAGLMGRVISFNKDKNEQFEVFLTLPSEGIKLDSTKGVDREIEKTLPKISDQISLVKNELEQWSGNDNKDKKIERESEEFDQNFFIREND